MAYATDPSHDEFGFAEWVHGIHAPFVAEGGDSLRRRQKNLTWLVEASGWLLFGPHNVPHPFLIDCFARGLNWSNG